MSPCPTCRGPARPRPENPSAPFCSERCRLVDLGRWLRGEYKLPADDDAGAEPGEGEWAS